MDKNNKEKWQFTDGEIMLIKQALSIAEAEFTRLYKETINLSNCAIREDKKEQLQAGEYYWGKACEFNRLKFDIYDDRNFE